MGFKAQTLETTEDGDLERILGIKNLIGRFVLCKMLPPMCAIAHVV